MIQFLFSLLFLSYVNTTQPTAVASPVPLAEHEFSLEKRYEDSFVNNVFKDNILLTVNYIAGEKIDPSSVDWGNVTKPFEYKISLRPGETFAFHDDVLQEYRGKVAKTTNAHFNATDGFKSSGWLVGDGVCHLASLLYWVALDAGLEAVAPVRHNFAQIPEIPREFGVSIYAFPGSQSSDQMQNLYITNNKDHEVAFEFKYDGKNLKITAVENL